MRDCKVVNMEACWLLEALIRRCLFPGALGFIAVICRYIHESISS